MADQKLDPLAYRGKFHVFHNPSHIWEEEAKCLPWWGNEKCHQFIRPQQVLNLPLNMLHTACYTQHSAWKTHQMTNKCLLNSTVSVLVTCLPKFSLNLCGLYMIIIWSIGEHRRLYTKVQINFNIKINSLISVFISSFT